MSNCSGEINSLNFVHISVKTFWHIIRATTKTSTSATLKAPSSAMSHRGMGKVMRSPRPFPAPKSTWSLQSGFKSPPTKASLIPSPVSRTRTPNGFISCQRKLKSYQELSLTNGPPMTTWTCLKTPKSWPKRCLIFVKILMVLCSNFGLSLAVKHEWSQDKLSLRLERFWKMLAKCWYWLFHRLFISMMLQAWLRRRTLIECRTMSPISA